VNSPKAPSGIPLLGALHFYNLQIVMGKNFTSKMLVWEPISLDHVNVIFSGISGNVAEYFYDFKTIDETRVWVKNAIVEHGRGKKLEYVLFENNDFIGMISPCYLTTSTVEIGMWITPEKQGQGYGSRALSKLLEHLQKEGVKEVLYETEPVNEASVRLAISLGFVLTRETSEMLTFMKWIN
jgi:RimJ/RimL family protein N-acetyltransferase